MQDKESGGLPEKCCANCGFLHGLARSPATREDAIFDPDLIRLEDYPPMPHPHRIPQGIITSLPYAMRVESFPSGVQSSYTANYTWDNTYSIGCYKKIIKPHKISPMGRSKVTSKGDELNYRPIESEYLLEAIRQERSNCDGFCSYRPGFTPSQHISLQIDEMRIEHELDHQKRLVEWSNHQESRWRTEEEKREEVRSEQEELSKVRDRNLIIWLAILGFVFTVIQIVMDYLLWQYPTTP